MHSVSLLYDLLTGTCLETELLLEHNYGVEHLLHYLDDFFTAGPANSDACEQSLNAMLTLCKTLNVPIKPSKVEDLATSLTFLGIHLNTMEASITPERKQSLLQELSALHSHNKCTKRELLSLIGKLSFSCKVVPAGHIFLRRLIDLSTTVRQLHHHIRLTADAHLDMQWWLDFLPQWSRKTLILENHWTPSTRMHYSLMPPEPMVGVLTGMADGSKADGLRCN